jgi:hypothetical protein
MTWIIVAIALYGTWLNARKNPNGFYFWLASNAYLSIYNLAIGELAMSLLFCTYFILAAYGLYKW